MRRTVGKTDRVVRGFVAIGAVIGGGILGFSTGWGIVLLVVAAVMALTGASGYCPIYSVLRVDTLDQGHAGTSAHRTIHLHRTT